MGVEQRLVGIARRLVHDARLGGLGAESEGGQHVGAEVDREDLHRGQGQGHRAAGEQVDGGGHCLGDVRVQDVEHELADVGVDRAALLDRVDDRGEVVIGQDHVRGLLGHVRARDAHGDADVGLLEGGGVVDAVAGDRDDLAHALQDLDDAQLLLRGHAREDDLALEGFPQVVVRGLLELDAREDARVGTLDDADLASDRDGRQAVVAGDHDDADAGATALGDGVGDLGTRWILHDLETDEGEVALDVVGGVLAHRVGEGVIVL